MVYDRYYCKIVCGRYYYKMVYGRYYYCKMVYGRYDFFECLSIIHHGLFSDAGSHPITSIMPSSVREMEQCSVGDLTVEATKTVCLIAHSMQATSITTMLSASSAVLVNHICLGLCLFACLTALL